MANLGLNDDKNTREGGCIGFNELNCRIIVWMARLGFGRRNPRKRIWSVYSLGGGIRLDRLFLFPRQRRAGVAEIFDRQQQISIGFWSGFWSTQGDPTHKFEADPQSISITSEISTHQPTDRITDHLLTVTPPVQARAPADVVAGGGGGGGTGSKSSIDLISLGMQNGAFWDISWDENN